MQCRVEARDAPHAADSLARRFPISFAPDAVRSDSSDSGHNNSPFHYVRYADSMDAAARAYRTVNLYGTCCSACSWVSSAAFSC